MDLKRKQVEIHPDVQRAQRIGKPIVALESTVITHGLPHPENVRLAARMESVVREHGAVPATIAVLDGRLRVGLDQEEIERLGDEPGAHKLSVRDLPAAMYHGWSGGTTVAATMFAARAAEIHVFATGGIGGVHRGAPTDVSADLPQLASTPMLVVCAGAKAILDIPATLEYLETYSVAVVGYGVEEFPAFYARSSGLPVQHRLDTPAAIVDYAEKHWGLGLRSAVLVAQPPPEDTALDASDLEEKVAQALAEERPVVALESTAAADLQGITGQAVTPFLLEQMASLTDSASLAANLALLENNAALAAEIAGALIRKRPGRIGFV